MELFVCNFACTVSINFDADLPILKVFSLYKLILSVEVDNGSCPLG